MSDSNKPLKHRPLESARILVCEGSDEYDLFTLLRNERGLGESDIEIVDACGRQNLLKTIDDQFYRSGGSAIRLMGAVLDSEDDLQETQRLVEDIRVQVGTRARWIHCQLPDVTSPGALETLIRQAIPAQSPGAACANQWEACLQAQLAAQDGKTQAQKDKAWLQVWLTQRTRDTAYSRIGYAIKNNADLRRELDTALQPLKTILDQILSAPLV
jgi:hypothetical protein